MIRYRIPVVVDGQVTEDTISIHAVVGDEEQAHSVIRSAIEGHPVFSHKFTKAMISRSAKSFFKLRNSKVGKLDLYPFAPRKPHKI